MTASAVNQLADRRQQAFTAVHPKTRIQDLTDLLYAITSQRQLDRNARSSHLPSSSEFFFGTAIEFVSYQARARNAYAVYFKTATISLLPSDLSVGHVVDFILSNPGGPEGDPPRSPANEEE